MNRILQDYFEAREKEKQEQRQELLKELGIYEKDYSPSGDWSSEYPDSEWNEEKQATLYYKKIPITVTDEEFAKISEYQKTDTKKSNEVATTFRVFAWIIFIVGFLVGFCSIAYTESFLFAVISLCVAFVAGMIYIGFAEIIQLLSDIKNK